MRRNPRVYLVFINKKECTRRGLCSKKARTDGPSTAPPISREDKKAAALIAARAARFELCLKRDSPLHGCKLENKSKLLKGDTQFVDSAQKPMRSLSSSLPLVVDASSS